MSNSLKSIDGQTHKASNQAKDVRTTQGFML